MKKVIVILGVLALALPAMADLSAPGDRSDTPIYLASDIATATPMDEQVGQRGTTVYDSIGPGTAGYLAGTPSVGPLGFDDYGTTSGVNLTSFHFVGGMSPIATGQNAVMWFTWFTSGGSFATSAGVVFTAADAGYYIWGITFSSPPFVIPHNGYFQVTANSTYTGGGTYSTTVPGLFFLSSTDALTVGSNNPTVGGGSTTGGANLVHCFSFDIPEPTTLGLLGAALLVLAPRRR
jgi:hypothetical protein